MGNRQNLSPARNQKTTELTNFSSFPDLNQKILQKKVCAAGSVTPMKPGTYSLYFKLHSTGLINNVAPGADIWITSGTTGSVIFRVVSVAKS
jgi:hypothetical protein